MCNEYYKCEDVKVLEQRLEWAKHFFEPIIEALYNKEVLPEMFEDWIEECAHQLHVKMPSGELNIEKKNETMKSIQFLLQGVLK